jgi:carnitine-CoA ligase
VIIDVEPYGMRVELDAASHAHNVLPRFARPRFVELVGELPKTATGKVQRAQLPKRGVGPATWDVEASG